VPVERFAHDAWNDALPARERERALDGLEAGAVLLFPVLRFALEPDEARFLTMATADGEAKNISYDPIDQRLSGSACRGDAAADLTRLMQRYARRARQLVESVAPAYAPRLEVARTSYRPIAVAGRSMPRLSDDTLLHVDAFPSRPTGGNRILRVFTNLNPTGAPRVWKLGEPFAAFAARFVGRIRRPLPGRAWLLERSGQTLGRRTVYDHYMLGLHDAAKLDADFQRRAPATQHDFPAGATWMVFSDVATHAALAGQFVLEQTFHLPIAAMQREALSPLRVLERQLGRRLV
jgi:hypothetical protein